MSPLDTEVPALLLRLDRNPFRLFVDRAGLDVVRALHLDLTGRPVRPERARAGRVFVAENDGLLAAPASARGPAVGAGRPDVEWAWFAADDPAPFPAIDGRLAAAGAALPRAAARGPGRGDRPRTDEGNGESER